MAEGKIRFCSLCDPSSIPATEYCTECDEFLCIDCVKPHQTSKRLKTHPRLSVDDYEKLPSYVRELQLTCQEHDEKLDSFCPVHNTPCCLRCAFEFHKMCEGVKPLKDSLSNSKDSSMIKDLEQIVNDVCKFVQKSVADRFTKTDMIAIQKEKIIEEIKSVKSAVISQLDKMETNLYEILDMKSNEILHDVDIFIKQIQTVSAKLVEMKEECRVIVKHASDLQTFLSLPVLLSSVGEKEKEVQRLSEDERLSHMNLSFQADECLTDIASMGVIETTSEERKMQYTKSKERQAQILGLVTAKQDRSISHIKSFKLDLNHPDNIITGCDLSKNGEIVVAEYNKSLLADRVALHDLHGHLVKLLTKRQLYSIFDVTVIDKFKTAFTSVYSVSFLCIQDSNNINLYKEMKTKFNVGLFGIALGDNDFLYVMEENAGINRYNTRTKETCMSKVIDTRVKSFSYVAYWTGKLVYTLGEEHNCVNCCDAETGNHLCTFEDTKMLRYPRALAVDKDGFIFVVGHASNNVVMITGDGQKANELVTCSEPTAICYMKDSHQLLVCDQRNQATIYQILDK